MTKIMICICFVMSVINAFMVGALSKDGWIKQVSLLMTYPMQENFHQLEVHSKSKRGSLNARAFNECWTLG